MIHPQRRPDTSSPKDGPFIQPFDEAVDETLIDLILELTISDRLRTLSRYANTLARLRRT